MYSLVIAEDELVTRRGLVNTVKWNELGFNVDAEFSDGQELLDYLKENMPDVILTDIRMSRVSGVDVARFVKEQNLPVQIVFLSGYREFSYAQSAVEYGVIHYLVKPVSVPQMRKIFTGIKERLDKQNRFQVEMLERADYYQKLVNHQKQQFVMDIWSGSFESPRQIEERLRLFSIEPYAGRRPHLYLVRITMRNDDQYRRFLDNYGIQELQEQMNSILGAFDSGLEYYPIQWERTNKNQDFSGLGILWEKENYDGGQNQATRTSEIKEHLREAVYSLFAIETELSIIKEMSNPNEMIFNIHSEDSQEAVQSQGKTNIENVLQYIQEHFCEDITLSDVAGEVYMNPVYISRLIKEKTGKNYKELLVELRIRKAVELLKNTDLYVYEIAEKVGYQNLKYFYKVFKREVGNSPSDHRPDQKENCGDVL